MNRTLLTEKLEMLLHEGACSMCVHTLWCRPLCALWKHSDEVVWTLGIAQHSTAPIEQGRVGETTTSQTNVQTTAGRQLCNKEHLCLRIIPYGTTFTLWMPIRKLRSGAEQTQMNGRECESVFLVLRNFHLQFGFVIRLEFFFCNEKEK